MLNPVSPVPACLQQHYKHILAYAGQPQFQDQVVMPIKCRNKSFHHFWLKVRLSPFPPPQQYLNSSLLLILLCSGPNLHTCKLIFTTEFPTFPTRSSKQKIASYNIQKQAFLNGKHLFAVRKNAVIPMINSYENVQMHSGFCSAQKLQGKVQQTQCIGKGLSLSVFSPYGSSLHAYMLPIIWTSTCSC